MNGNCELRICDFGLARLIDFDSDGDDDDDDDDTMMKEDDSPSSIAGTMLHRGVLADECNVHMRRSRYSGAFDSPPHTKADATAATAAAAAAAKPPSSSSSSSSPARVGRHLTTHVVTRWYRAPELVLEVRPLLATRYFFLVLSRSFY